MNNIAVIEEKNKNSKSLILKVEDIKHIKNNVDLSLNMLIQRLIDCIKECNFQEGREHYIIAKRLYNNNPKINSLGFILESKNLKLKYESSDDYYIKYLLKEELNKLINSITYLGEIEDSEEYNLAYNEVLNLRNKVDIEEISYDLNKRVKEINNSENKKNKILIKEIFKDKYEDNFYNSAEFTYNIIENNIYKNIEDFNELQKVLDKIYLLYKFNLEKDINKKVEILYDMSINEFMNIEYVYKGYVVRTLEKNNYKTIDELREDILKLGNKIKSFDKKSMPI
ncbi:hypothetical protein [Clostridium tertium]|uniref:hypothetical protein n=1 Tax=Clostridium tertium TaxID=1559 RepID=UPI0024B33458|nr:hypothetical protein [Clostridium tertium]MDI9216994.1 hypothetical protein [Clostridium tertium]